MGSQSINTVMDYNDRFCAVTLGNKFRIADTSRSPYRFHTRDDFLMINETDSFENDEGKRIFKAKVWLSHPSRRSYDRVAFAPGLEDDAVLNLWPGFAVQPNPKAKCDAWLKLAREVICGTDEEFNWLMNWLAAILIEPANPARTALAIIGVQGAGKSLFMQYFGKMLGDSYVVVTDDKHVHGSFNAHLSTALLLHSEEALFAGDHRHRGIIKSLITDAKRMVEHKGVDAYQVDNYVRLVLLSNDWRVAPAEKNDRRFTIIDMITDKRKASSELVKAVVKEMNGDGPAALFHYLTEIWKYDGSVISVNLKNEALNAVKQTNLDPVANWWSDRLREGQILPDELMWATASFEEFSAWPDYVGFATLHAYMVNCLRTEGARQIPHTGVFGIKLKEMMDGLPYSTNAKRRYDKPMRDELPNYARELSDRQYSLRLPSLGDCRKAFERSQGSTVDWPGDLPDDEKGAWEKDAEAKKNLPKY
jgi:hypothetical protein